MMIYMLQFHSNKTGNNFLGRSLRARKKFILVLIRRYISFFLLPFPYKGKIIMPNVLNIFLQTGQ